jgi:osmotically-inducible protein OsmY
MKRSDIDIRRDVEAELQWNPSVDDHRIGVLVNAGVVTLTGEATHLTGRWAAEDTAKRVSGVRAIANEIQVKIPLSGIRCDTDIAEAAANALHWNVATTGCSITPVVKDGTVALSGTATWRFQKLAAERTIQHLLGVRFVQNNIRVASAIKPSDVKRHIEDALKRRAIGEAQAIDVIVEDATIVLSGRVHSWQEQLDAVSAARSAPGVAHVDNRLEVR